MSARPSPRFNTEEIINRLKKEIEASRYGMKYYESIRRIALFPVIVIGLSKDRVEAKRTLQEIIQDSYTANLSLLEYIVGIYEGKYSYRYISNNRDIFDEGIDYIITGNKEKEKGIDSYFLDKAKNIAKEVTSNYLKELMTK